MGPCVSKSDGPNTNVVQPTEALSQQEQDKVKEELRFASMLRLMQGEKTGAMLDRKDKFMENYRIGMLIGYGTYGEVRVCQQIRTKHKRSVRILNKKLMDDGTVNKFMTMIMLLQHCDHPNILRFQEIFQDKKRFFIVTELC